MPGSVLSMYVVTWNCKQQGGPSSKGPYQAMYKIGTIMRLGHHPVVLMRISPCTKPPELHSHLQQADILVQDVLRAAVCYHAFERDVGTYDLHQLVCEVVLAPNRSKARAAQHDSACQPTRSCLRLQRAATLLDSTRSI